VLAILLVALAPSGATNAASLRFGENAPAQYDFADLATLPPSFGRGEFTFELWIKPDASFPVGQVWRASYAQLRNWSEADPEPYSSDGWWLPGNWLLDGHTRPRGFDAGDTREGTFSLQFYGGGRLRFMFADSGTDMPRGMVWAVQTWPASETASLLDDAWHHVAVVRRWREPSGARLELWIDGAEVAHTDIPQRIDMRRFWDALPHPGDPAELGGWAFGSEVMTAWNYFFTQYEDYKGMLDELRFWDRARSRDELANRWREIPAEDADGLVGWYRFDEATGNVAADRFSSERPLLLHRMADGWVDEDAPGEGTEAVNSGRRWGTEGTVAIDPRKAINLPLLAGRPRGRNVAGRFKVSVRWKRTPALIASVPYRQALKESAQSRRRTQ
jgi:hypothetical protein